MATSEISVELYQPSRRLTPENNKLPSHSSGNIKFPVRGNWRGNICYTNSVCQVCQVYQVCLVCLVWVSAAYCEIFTNHTFSSDACKIVVTCRSFCQLPATGKLSRVNSPKIIAL